MEARKPKKGVIAIICAAVVLIAAAVAAVLLLGKGGGEAYRTITVAELEGTALVSNAKASDTPAYSGMALFSGDRTAVGDVSRMVMELDGDKYMMAGAGTVFTLEADGRPGSERTVICLESGDALIRIKNKLEPDQSYIVSTPTASVAVRGTVYYVTVAENDEGRTVVTCSAFDGKVEVTPLDEDGDPAQDSQIIPAGYAAGVVEILPRENDGTGSAEFIVGADGEILTEVDYASLPRAVLEELMDYLDDGQELSIDRQELESLLEGHVHTFSEVWSFDEYEHWHESTCEPAGELRDEAGPHQWDGGQVTLEPTHLTPGTVAYTCTVCGYTREETLPPTDEHEWGGWIQDKGGIHRRTCPCGQTETGAHVWDEGRIVTAPTETEPGEAEYTCTLCGCTKTSAVPAGTAGHEHTFSDEWTIDLYDHWHVNNCDDPACGEVHTPHEPHVWDEGVVTTPPTAEAYGVRTYTCAVCSGKKYAQEPMLTEPDDGGNTDETGLGYFSNGDGTCSVTGRGGSFTDLVIPEYSPDGDRVTAISDHGFYICENLTSVTLPATLERIGEYAFAGCDALTEIVIPEGVTFVGTHAFENCTALETAVLPGSLQYIEDATFLYCEKLINVNVPEGVVFIGREAFRGCYDLRQLALPSTLGEIGPGAFNGCANLISVAVPAGVTAIPEEAFRHCVSLESVTLPESLVSIASNAFNGCTALTELNIPRGVTEIGDSAFANCSALESIAIPAGITKISADMFNGCSSLSKVAMPDSVTEIDRYSFAWCSALRSIDIPDGVTSISYNAFYACVSLESVTLPEGLVSLGVSAFEDCQALESAVIPGSLSVISDGAFRYCEKLRTVTIGDGVRTVGFEAFCNCHALLSVTLPDSVTEIGESAFANCFELESINIPRGVTVIESGVFYGCYVLQEIELHDGMTQIGEFAFSNCAELKSVVIPQGITAIPNNAFDYCYALESVVLPESLTSIGGWAFCECTSLAEVTIPQNVTFIGSYAFAMCPMESIVIPESVTVMEEDVFAGYEGTVYVEADSKPEGWNEYWNLSGGTDVVWGHK